MYSFIVAANLARFFEIVRFEALNLVVRFDHPHHYAKSFHRQPPFTFRRGVPRPFFVFPFYLGFFALSILPGKKQKIVKSVIA